MRKTAVLCLTLALAPTSPARAQRSVSARPIGEARVPNFLGTTGLLLIPSAYLQRDRQLSAVGGGSGDFVAGGVLAGWRNRLELGAVGLDPDTAFDGGGTRLVANAKLGLFQETLLRPAVSVGVTDSFGRLEEDPSWYLVVSKYLIRYFVEGVTDRNVALKLHVGFGGGIYDHDLITGVELFFPRRVSALAEYENGALNLGGRLHAGRFTGTLGLFDLDHVGGSVSYSLWLQ